MALLNLFVKSAANDEATYSEWNNMSDVNQTATSEQGWKHKEPTPRRKQSTNSKQLTPRNKNALVRVTIQENKIMPNKTPVFCKICIFGKCRFCMKKKLSLKFTTRYAISR